MQFHHTTHYEGRPWLQTTATDEKSASGRGDTEPGLRPAIITELTRLAKLLWRRDAL